MSIYMRGPEGKSRVLTFSYDDGVEQDIRLIEILNKHGMRGTFNINSGCFAADGVVYPEGQVHRRMTRSMCEKTYDGHEIAVHTYSHPSLAHISESDCYREVYDDRLALENLAGYPVRGMAYPCGTYNDSVVEVIKKCGIVYSRTVNPTFSFDIPKDWLRLDPTCHHNHEQLFPLAEKFLTMNTADTELQLFYLWGHAYEFESCDNWERIEKFCGMLAGYDDIWYATNIEIYDYVKSFGELIFALDNSFVKNPTATALWFELDGKLYSVAPGETLKI